MVWSNDGQILFTQQFQNASPQSQACLLKESILAHVKVFKSPVFEASRQNELE